MQKWDDSKPIYQQLKEKITDSILENALAEDAVIPSIRQVSSEYQVNPITVSKAYQALVSEEIIEKRRGIGMFVRIGAKEKLLASAKKQFLQEEWPRILEKIKRLNLDIKDISS